MKAEMFVMVEIADPYRLEAHFWAMRQTSRDPFSDVGLRSDDGMGTRVRSVGKSGSGVV